MASIAAVFLICASTVSTYSVTVDGVTERGTVAYRSPAQCWTPPLVTVIDQKQATGGKVEERVPVKKATAKKRHRPHCKPGRVRNSRGWCVRR